MAEFQEVMREALRLCDSLLKPGSENTHFCERCPLNTGYHRDNCFVTYSTKPRNFAEAEKAVMKWAAEHPHMTWSEFMDNYNLLYTGGDGSSRLNPIKAHEYVPDEIVKIIMRKRREAQG